MNGARNRNLILAFALAVLVMLSCNLSVFGTVRGSGNVVEEARTVGGVTGVELATIGNLTIEMGETESLRIEAEDNLLEYFETEVRDGNLLIRTRNNTNLRATRPVNYYLTVTSLEAIRISSSGDIQAPDLRAGRFSITISSSGSLEMGDLETDALTVEISSSGDVTLGELSARTIEVDINSSGDLDIAGGQVTTQNINIGSSGNYNAQDLASDKADVRLSSSGSAYIWVQEAMKANLSSSGNVRYRGNPTVDADTDSSGDVIQIGE